MIDLKSETGKNRNKNVRCPHCGNGTPKNLYEVEKFTFEVRPNDLGNSIELKPYLCGECGTLFISRKDVNNLKDFEVDKRILPE